MKHERNYGIDLLRLVFMYMICMMHTLGQGGILDTCIAGTVQYRAFMVLNIVSYCAVDGFAIISGYMSNGKPPKYEKLADMWFQAFFYSFVVTLLFTIAGINDTWNKADMIKCAMPVTTGKFWYFTAFFALYFTMPVLNQYLFSIDEKEAKKAFLLILVLFSVLGVLRDPFQTRWGFSALWLMILYCIGVLARKIHLFETRSSGFLFLLWAACVTGTWVIDVFMGIDRLTNYISPTILFSGLIMVVLFSRMKLKGTLIAKLSPLAFGIYLFHFNQVIWERILKHAFAGAADKPVYIGIPLAILFAFSIFVSGICVEFIRSRLAKILRIHVLSEKIVMLFDTILGRLIIFLK